MKRKIFFLSLILPILSANVFAQKQSAAKFVESFYDFHRARSGIFDQAEVKAHRRWFTPALNRLFQIELQREAEFLKQNPTDKPHFGDGFPFQPLEECSKNGKFFKNDLKTSRETKVSALVSTVEVRFYQPKVCGGELIDTYKVELGWSKSGWKINDWIYSDNSRLSEDLKRTEY
jgi:hypothetical protein